ncbi:MAG: glycosyltransferase [Planctomycetota bacterium]|jgi:glycosyltransferase involved in cell wall biosynthesis
MRVALVSNALAQPTRGNHTTIQRWIRNVNGIEIVAVPAHATPEFEAPPDLVNGYHALNGGLAARRLAHRYDCPLVVNLGGTDLFACLQGDRAVADVLEAADAITGAFPAFGERLAKCFGRPVPYSTVPRGVPVPDDLPPHGPGETLHVLLPAGLRPVKDPMYAVDLAERLGERGIPLDLRILGPELDGAYARRISARAAGLRFVTLGEAGHDEMPAAYRRADVVWNTSLHEGGSNALLEAVAQGCAVYARDIPGNHELLHEKGAPGVLFDPDDVDGAETFHRALLTETDATRAARIAAGHAWLRRHHDPAAEARALERVWRSLAT